MRIVIGALALLALTGCVPLVVGAGGVVVADEIAEDQRGDDGLF